MITRAAAHDATRTEVARPRPGRSLAAAAQLRAGPVQQAVQALANSVSDEGLAAFEEIFAPRINRSKVYNAEESKALRAAWAIANLWLLHAIRSESSGSTLEEAEDWFIGSRRTSLPSLVSTIDTKARAKVLTYLRGLFPDPEFRSLLPYVLEPHGFVHRLNALRCSEAATARSKKRTSGVFYTPPDVADFMVGWALATAGLDTPERFLDPSCGTGVFFLALDRAYRTTRGPSGLFDFWQSTMFGIDVSALALESCSFCATLSCLDDPTTDSLDPWAVWHSVRLNLVTADATAIGRPEGGASGMPHVRHVRDQILDQANSPTPRPHIRTSVSSAEPVWQLKEAEGLDEVFPEAPHGFQLLVTNPPYAPQMSAVGDGRASKNLFPIFVQLACRFTTPNRSVACQVLPLSIAFAQDKTIRAARRRLSHESSSLEFAFFDREPHGLFGEEVKTRAAVFVRVADDARNQRAAVKTTPLIRSTSRTREQVLRHVPLQDLGAVSIEEGIPKLAGSIQHEAYRLLMQRAQTLEQSLVSVRSAPVAELLDEPVSEDAVYVAHTAYNFLNVSRSLVRPSAGPEQLSTTSVTCLQFTSPFFASVGFAVLSSRLAYWLWTVLGDGFHLTKSFILKFPVSVAHFTVAGQSRLSHSGDDLWTAMRANPVESVNGGRRSITHTPLPVDRLRDPIDSVLVRELGLPPTFLDELRSFVRDRVVVDTSDSRRSSLFPQATT